MLKHFLPSFLPSLRPSFFFTLNVRSCSWSGLDDDDDDDDDALVVVVAEMASTFLVQCQLDDERPNFLPVSHSSKQMSEWVSRFGRAHLRIGRKTWENLARSRVCCLERLLNGISGRGEEPEVEVSAMPSIGRFSVVLALPEATRAHLALTIVSLKALARMWNEYLWDPISFREIFLIHPSILGVCEQQAFVRTDVCMYVYM